MKRIFIETGRLLLRQWTPEDIDPFAALTADPVVMEFFPSVLSRDEAIAAIRRYRDSINTHGRGFFAAERKDTGAFIGFTGLSSPLFSADFTPCIEIGWRLSRENWGQGFATEAATACLEFGFATLGLDRIYSFTAKPNLKSQNVMKKIGMQFEGFFEHPSFSEGHWLQRHVLYKIEPKS